MIKQFLNKIKESILGKKWYVYSVVYTYNDPQEQNSSVRTTNATCIYRTADPLNKESYFFLQDSLREKQGTQYLLINNIIPLGTEYD